MTNPTHISMGLIIQDFNSLSLKPYFQEKPCKSKNLRNLWNKNIRRLLRQTKKSSYFPQIGNAECISTNEYHSSPIIDFKETENIKPSYPFQQQLNPISKKDKRRHTFQFDLEEKQDLSKSTERMYSSLGNIHANVTEDRNKALKPVRCVNCQRLYRRYLSNFDQFCALDCKTAWKLRML